MFTTQVNESDIVAPADQVLLCPVGNKINILNLTKNECQTLPFQNRSNIAMLRLSPDKKVLVSIDVDGFSLIINFESKVVLSHFNFRDKVTAFEFSPDSQFFIVATGTKVKIFECPKNTVKLYSPLVLYKKYGNLHTQTINGACWTHDSKFIVTWSDD